jgi:hypothetical protein
LEDYRGERGERGEAGWLPPFFTVSAAHAATAAVNPSPPDANS